MNHSASKHLENILNQNTALLQALKNAIGLRDLTHRKIYAFLFWAKIACTPTNLVEQTSFPRT